MFVTETFFALEVRDIARAAKFYVEALAATVLYESPEWTSLQIAGVRLGLAPGTPKPTGLHFAVDDLAGALAAIRRAGGRVLEEPTAVTDRVTLATAEDPEGNSFTLRA